MFIKYFLFSIFSLIIGFLISILNVVLCKCYEDEEGKKKEKFKISSLIKVNDIIITQILTIIISLGVLFLYDITLEGILILVFCYYMISLTIVDARLQILPDILTVSLIALGLIIGWYEIFTDFRSSVIGAFVGYFSLWTINTLFRIIRGKEGMGYGDFKLFSAIGAWIGWQQLPLVILMSSIMAIFVAIGISKLYKSELNAPTPFGPSLALAGIVGLIWGNQIISWYLGLFMPNIY